MPSTPKGWFCKAIYILDAQGRPFSPQMDRIRGTGPRYSREEALSVKIIAERASRECTSNGVGLALMTAFFLEEVSWYSLTEIERWRLEKTIGRFRRGLVAAGFIEGKG